MRNLKKILVYPIAMIGLFLSCFAPVSISAADASSEGYIDTGWIGYSNPSYSNTYFTENGGMIPEYFIRKDGQEYNPVYCYNAERHSPDIKGTNYSRYGFYYGMNNRGTDLGSPAKVNAIAAVLYAGYPNNGLNDTFKQLAEDSYEAFMVSAMAENVPADYTYEMFLQDSTQEAIWKIDGIMSHLNVSLYADQALVDPYKDYGKYGNALVQYALNHPLTPAVADAKNLRIVDGKGKEISSANRLVADMNNGGFTQSFSIKGFSGAVELTPNTDWEVYNAKTNQKISNTQLIMGKIYKLKYVGKVLISDTGNIKLVANYKNLKDSYFFEPTSIRSDGEHWQNLVCLNTALEQKEIAAKVKVKRDNTTDVKFNKFEVTGSKELAGAHMQVIDKATGNIVAEWISNADGVDKIFKAEEGKEYILKETIAPKGYDIISDTAFAVVNKKVRLTGDVNVKADNKDNNLVLISDDLLSTTTYKVSKKTTDVKFNKFEATGSKELAGAHMQVIDKATGNIVAEWDSNANGVDKIFKAEEGKNYILREKLAPKGYEVISDTSFTVTNRKIQLIGDKNVKVDGKDSNLLLINDQSKKVKMQTVHHSNVKKANKINKTNYQKVANKKGLVNTGDSSNILELLIILLGSLIMMALCVNNKHKHC